MQQLRRLGVIWYEVGPMDDAQDICFGVLLIIVVIAMIAGNRSSERTIRGALPGTWRRRFGGRMTTTWNGHPVSADLKGEADSDYKWAVVEIGVSSPARVHVKRRGFLGAQFGKLPLVTLDGDFGDLEVRSDDPAFALRLFSDPVMAKTLSLTLRESGEEIVISHEAVCVVRFAVDGVEREALQSAWSLATGVVIALEYLSPPSQ